MSMKLQGYLPTSGDTMTHAGLTAAIGRGELLIIQPPCYIEGNSNSYEEIGIAKSRFDEEKDRENTNWLDGEPTVAQKIEDIIVDHPIVIDDGSDHYWSIEIKKQETMICFVSELFIIAVHNLEPFKAEVEKINTTTPAAVSVSTKDLGEWVDTAGTRHSEIKEIIVRFETSLIKDADILERWDSSLDNCSPSDCDCQWTKYIDLSEAARMTANFMFGFESTVAAMAIDGDCLEFGYEEVSA